MIFRRKQLESATESFDSLMQTLEMVDSLVVAEQAARNGTRPTEQHRASHPDHGHQFARVLAAK
jgi:hypothetical protein